MDEAQLQVSSSYFRSAPGAKIVQAFAQVQGLISLLVLSGPMRPSACPAVPPAAAGAAATAPADCYDSG